MKNTLLTTRFALLAAVFGVLLGCDNEQPVRSVSEFMENPILLEAAVVRCAQNRAESRYDPECVNAREAIKILEAREEAERKAELEAMSERKREALRRTQRAAAEARRRAAEERALREEAAYLAQFGETPRQPAGGDQGVTGSNAPTAVLPEPAAVPASRAPQPITSPYDNAPVAEAPRSEAPASVEVIAEPPPQQQTTDLEAIREELRRRNEDGS